MLGLRGLHTHRQTCTDTNNSTKLQKTPSPPPPSNDYLAGSCHKNGIPFRSRCQKRMLFGGSSSLKSWGIEHPRNKHHPLVHEYSSCHNKRPCRVQLVIFLNESVLAWSSCALAPSSCTRSARRKEIQLLPCRPQKLSWADSSSAFCECQLVCSTLV